MVNLIGAGIPHLARNGAGGAYGYQLKGAGLQGVYVPYMDDRPGGAGRVHADDRPTAGVLTSTATIGEGYSHYQACRDRPNTKEGRNEGIVDCAAWDETTGTGSFRWIWASCCSDGLVMGPFPMASDGGFDFHVEMFESNPSNPSHSLDSLVEIFKFGTFNKDTNSMEYVSICYNLVY